MLSILMEILYLLNFYTSWIINQTKTEAELPPIFLSWLKSSLGSLYHGMSPKCMKLWGRPTFRFSFSHFDSALSSYFDFLFFFLFRAATRIWYSTCIIPLAFLWPSIREWILANMYSSRINSSLLFFKLISPRSSFEVARASSYRPRFNSNVPKKKRLLGYWGCLFVKTEKHSLWIYNAY